MDISNLNECFEEACRLKDEGKYEEAVSMLFILNKHYPDNFAITMLMGLIYHVGIEDFTNAEIYLKRATELNKSSELVSAALYHCLLYLGKEKEAMED